MLYEYFIIGIITNFVILFLMSIFWLYILFKIGVTEVEKLKYELENNDLLSNKSIVSWLNYLIPFYTLYTTYVEIKIYNRYFNYTAESLINIMILSDKYKIFRAFK